MNNNKSIELEKFRELMINSCITAGAELNKLFLSRSFSSTIKGNYELVTGADIISENILIELISNYNFNIISEECGKIDHDSEYTFIIDPLCGTVNFAKNIGHSAISIALQHNSQIIVGVVYDFIRNDIYSAILNEGAFINEKKICLTNSTNNITRALICISDMDGNVDVVIADGFTGNVALKTAEGTANFITKNLKEKLSNNFFSKISLLFSYKVLKEFKHQCVKFI